MCFSWPIITWSWVSEWCLRDPESCSPFVVNSPRHRRNTHTHIYMNSCILSSTHYPVSHKQQWQHMWHLNEHRSPLKKNHTRNYTLGVIMKHTRKKRSHKSRYDLSSVAQLFFCTSSNVVRADIHHLDDILMSHPRAVSISPPPLSHFFLSLPHVGHHFINKPPHH